MLLLTTEGPSFLSSPDKKWIQFCLLQCKVTIIVVSKESFCTEYKSVNKVCIGPSDERVREREDLTVVTFCLSCRDLRITSLE